MKTFVKNNRIYILYALAFLVCLVRATRGFCWSDETFYISTADRFYKGDALIFQEWYRTQMSSVIILPFYALYRAVVGNTNGIILFFRILYLLLSFATGIVTAKVLKKEYPLSVSTGVALFIFFYAHLNITTLSYYMLSLDFFLLSLVLIYDYKNTKSEKELIVAGLFFSLSVLALPSLAAMYFLVFLFVLLCVFAMRIKKIPEKFKEKYEIVSPGKILFYVTVGIAIPFVIFLIYMFSKINVSQLIKSIPYIMIDNEHDFTLGYSFRKFFRSITDVYGRWTYLGYLSICISIVYSLLFRYKYRIFANFMVLCNAFLFIIFAIKSFGHTGYIQTAFCMFAIPVFFLSMKKNYRLFVLFGIGGMSLAMTYSFSSSDFLYVLAIGHFVTAIAGIAFVYDYILAESKLLTESDTGSDNKYDTKFFNTIGLKIEKVAILSITLVVIYTIGATIGLRLTNVYRDAPINKLNCKILDGPGKGLYTTNEHLKYYNSVCDMIENDIHEEDVVMFSKILPWGYMYTNAVCGYPTTWRSTSYTGSQLEEYYKFNPERKPNCIVVLNEEYGSYDACGDVEDDHNPNLDEMNDYWIEYLSNNNFEKKEVECGVIYRK